MVLPGHLLEPLGISLTLLARGGYNGSISDNVAAHPNGSAAVPASLLMIFRLPLYMQLPGSHRLHAPIAVASRSSSGAAASSRSDVTQHANAGHHNLTRLAGKNREHVARAVQLRAGVGMRRSFVAAGGSIIKSSRGNRQLPSS